MVDAEGLKTQIWGVKRHYFNLREANALLPRVTPVAQRLVQLHAHLQTTLAELSDRGVDLGQEVLAGLEAPPRETGQDLLIGQAQMLYDCVLDQVDKLERMGGEVKDLGRALVDFWAKLDGKSDVLLCWQLGEERIEHYRTPNAGFADRKSVYGHSFDESAPALSTPG